MCTVTIIPKGKQGFVLTSNRDEAPERESLAPEFYTIEGAKVLFPKIVGETGGKDFIVAHKSANPKQVATAIIRGAFEFQGQKCSAASRAYIPKSIWDDVKTKPCLPFGIIVTVHIKT